MSVDSVPPVAEMVQALEAVPLDGAPPEPVNLASASLACVACGTPTAGAHYLVNGQRSCTRCAGALAADQSTQLGRFSRGFFFGTVVATVCAAIWYGVMTVTGYELGLLALIVGLVVGIAVRLGSRERGGWVYQGMAVTLTYLAIVSTHVPMVVDTLTEGIEEQQAAGLEVGAGTKPTTALPSTVVAHTGGASAEVPPALLYSVAVALAVISPILLALEDFTGSLMSLIIIGIALYEAWKVNQGNGAHVVEGPFETSEA